MKKKGLYANIHAKRKRIKAGSEKKCESPELKVRLLGLHLRRQLKPLERRSDA